MSACIADSRDRPIIVVTFSQQSWRGVCTCIQVALVIVVAHIVVVVAWMVSRRLVLENTAG